MKNQSFSTSFVPMTINAQVQLPDQKMPTPVTLTPLQNGQVKFEFPDMSEDIKNKARNVSLTEFNNFMLKL
jgi:hypothetical protein